MNNLLETYLQHLQNEESINKQLLEGKILDTIEWFGSAFAGILTAREIRRYFEGQHLDQRLPFQRDPDSLGAGEIAIVLAGGVVAMFIIDLSYKAFKKHMEKVTYCSKYSGEEKEKCKHQFKITAIKSRIQTLEKGSVICLKSKNPQDCKKKINVKVNKLKQQLTEK